MRVGTGAPKAVFPTLNPQLKSTLNFSRRDLTEARISTARRLKHVGFAGARSRHPDHSSSKEGRHSCRPASAGGTSARRQNGIRIPGLASVSPAICSGWSERHSRAPILSRRVAMATGMSPLLEVRKSNRTSAPGLSAKQIDPSRRDWGAGSPASASFLRS